MIVAAAIKHEGKVYALPAPARHGDVIKHIYERTGGPVPRASEQGFIDSELGFLGRAGALQRAIDERQIAGKSGQLYSEDLW